MVYEEILSACEKWELTSSEYYKISMLVHYCEDGDIGEFLTEFHCDKIGGLHAQSESNKIGVR